MLEDLPHFIGIAQRQRLARQNQTDAHQRLAEFAEQRLGNRVIGYPQANGAALGVQQHARHFARGIENKGVGPRRMVLQ
ncbi:hypothetical protein D3C71_2083750 [compost metagenome]